MVNELPWQWLRNQPAHDDIELTKHERVAWWAICNNEPDLQ